MGFPITSLVVLACVLALQGSYSTASSPHYIDEDEMFAVKRNNDGRISKHALLFLLNNHSSHWLKSFRIRAPSPLDDTKSSSGLGKRHKDYPLLVKTILESLQRPARTTRFGFGLGKRNQHQIPT